MTQQLLPHKQIAKLPFEQQIIPEIYGAIFVASFFILVFITWRDIASESFYSVFEYFIQCLL